MLLLFPLQGSTQEQDLRFFTSLPDLPLMAGLEELDEEGVSFDKPEGRIIESFAVSDSLKQVEIMRFYEEVLPQLGWSRLGENAFERENEILSFKFESEEARIFVTLMVSPKQYPL